MLQQIEIGRLAFILCIIRRGLLFMITSATNIVLLQEGIFGAQQVDKPIDIGATRVGAKNPGIGIVQTRFGAGMKVDSGHDMARTHESTDRGYQDEDFAYCWVHARQRWRMEAIQTVLTTLVDRERNVRPTLRVTLHPDHVSL